MIIKSSLFTLLPLMLLFTSCNKDEDQLIKSARSGTIASRIGAVKKLAKYNSSKAVDTITKALTDRSALVRRTAAKSLEGKGLQVAWPLIHRLRDGDPRVRIRVVITLFTLGDAPFIYNALISKLDDKSGQVRKVAFKGFLDAGFPLSDLLALRTFSKRLSIIDTLGEKSAAARAAGVKAIGQMGQPYDSAFILPYIESSDPFLHASSLFALARTGGESELKIILSLKHTPPQIKAILFWLKHSRKVSQTSLRLLLNCPIDNDIIIESLPKIHATLPCALLPKLKTEKAIVRYKNSKCKIPDSLSPLKKIILLTFLKRDLPSTLLPLNFAETIKTIDGIGINAISRHKILRDSIIPFMEIQWKKFLFSYTKWVPDSLWKKMEVVGISDLEPVESSKKTPRQRFFSTHRKKINVHFEKELLPPQFDFAKFIDRIKGLKGFKPARPFLLKLMKNGSTEIIIAALYALYPSSPDTLFPPAILKKSEDENIVIKRAAINLLFAHGKINHILKFFKFGDPQILEYVYQAIEITGSPKGAALVLRQFKIAPTARLAKILGKLKTKKAVPELLSLLREDTSSAMSNDRAILIKAIWSIDSTNPDVREIVKGELNHPSPMVRCTALKLLNDKKLSAIYHKYDPSLLVRRCY
jgi:HEAT repeat associated with sister chromatid cohesion